METQKITGREPGIILDSGNKGKRRLSLRRLGTMLNMLPPDAVSLDAIREMLRSDETLVRFNAAQLLAKRADRDARHIIEDALSDSKVQTRASVARVLYGFSWYSAEPLINNVLADDDPRVRESAVYALCDMQHFNAYSRLVEALENEEDSVLEAAAFGLRDTEEGAAVPILQKILNANDPEIRVKALEVLGMCGAAEAIPVTREALLDNDPDVKYAAVLSLLELAGEDFLVELADVIGRTTGKAREQVLKAFFHATNYLKIDVVNSSAADSMLNALQHALIDEYPPARMAAIWSLSWLRHERTDEMLKDAYHHETDNEVKAHIVRVTANLMTEAGDIILEDALNNMDAIVQNAAQKIIDERERTGITLTYDENAYEGRAMDKDLLMGYYFRRKR